MKLIHQQIDKMKSQIQSDDQVKAKDKLSFTKSLLNSPLHRLMCRAKEFENEIQMLTMKKSKLSEKIETLNLRLVLENQKKLKIMNRLNAKNTSKPPKHKSSMASFKKMMNYSFQSSINFNKLPQKSRQKMVKFDTNHI